ncbi:MAG: MgtC/SapB family protein [Synergistales bacterium]|nr:MgtC/SapB family protein [Bacteroidales bacterium]MDY6435824.1 MgtC/SapB family protein [Synergistales bacterium]MDY6394378.1 MgtC/SapB family protein [Bacteroidales bacterium]MDY6395176.1 MgtC/SapB family protein [Bacteroidales bacterium]MDY6402363.1 MgtC/SapB family protein [Bacteroidales bacterium]
MDWDYIIRLLLAAVLGGVIGLEREYHAKEAGFRTHVLVAVGSALFMLISQYGFDAFLGVKSVSFDPSRIASQVVTGIGFIGAGTIIFQKKFIRGLTTAAGIWVTGAIGLACGCGMYFIAAVTTAIVILVLSIINYFLKKLTFRHISIVFSCSEQTQIEKILNNLKTDNIVIKECSIEKQSNYIVSLEIRTKRYKYNTLISEIYDKFSQAEIISLE